MCSHISKIVEWKLDENTNFVAGLYGCTKCDEVSESPLSSGLAKKEHLHDTYVHDCFTCKVETLQLNTGDAAGHRVQSGWTKKKLNNELGEYRAARKQGIQPDSTKTKDIRKAVELSNKTGHAYGSKI